MILAEKAKSKKPGRIQSYFRETSGELRKVSWPTRREALQLTGLVILVTVVVGTILGITDAIARQMLAMFLS
jgi:preprotein translocase subunit SecE